MRFIREINKIEIHVSIENSNILVMHPKIIV